MKQMNNRTAGKIMPIVFCGALSVLIDFILIPQVLTRLPRSLRSLLLPDPIWMSLMILIPVLVGICILKEKEYTSAGYVWIGLPVQYLILIVFADPISRIGGWGEWTYIWDAIIWPLGVTAAQFVSLITLRNVKVKRSK